MRTTIDIEGDVLSLAQQMANRQRIPLGTVISRLLRGAMSGASDNDHFSIADPRSVAGFQPFPSQGVLITNAQIEALRDAGGA
jgi:hypothetical protein